MARAVGRVEGVAAGRVRVARAFFGLNRRCDVRRERPAAASAVEAGFDHVVPAAPRALPKDVASSDEV